MSEDFGATGFFSVTSLSSLKRMDDLLDGTQKKYGPAYRKSDFLERWEGYPLPWRMSKGEKSSVSMIPGFHPGVWGALRKDNTSGGIFPAFSNSIATVKNSGDRRLIGRVLPKNIRLVAPFFVRNQVGPGILKVSINGKDVFIVSTTASARIRSKDESEDARFTATTPW